MIKINRKIAYVSLMFIMLFILSMAQPSLGSFEYKVQTGASMEYKVTDVKINENSWIPIWLSGFPNSINITKDTKIKVDVTNGTASDVKGTVSVIESGKTTISGLLSLTSVWFGGGSFVSVNLPFVQLTTDKTTWQQIATSQNQQLQGNILTTKWEWNQNNGLISQETRMNIISGFVEFFAFIFLVDDNIVEIFSMTRSSPVVPGFEIPTIMVLFIALAIIIRVKSKQET